MFFLCQTPQNEVRISYEHKDAKWLEYKEAMKALGFENSRELLKKADRFVSGKNDIKNRSEIRDLRNTVKRIQDLNSISVFRLANAFKNIDLIREMIGEDEFTRWIEKSVFNFAVGSEESGHNITGGLIRDKKRSLQPVFIGNGLKSALNSFASTCSLYWHRNRHFKVA